MFCIGLMNKIQLSMLYQVTHKIEHLGYGERTHGSPTIIKNQQYNTKLKQCHTACPISTITVINLSPVIHTNAYISNTYTLIMLQMLNTIHLSFL